MTEKVGAELLRVCRELAKWQGISYETFLQITTVSDFYRLAKMRGLI